MADVFERLDREVAVVRGEMDVLREKLAAAEVRLTRFGDHPRDPAVTRRRA